MKDPNHIDDLDKRILSALLQDARAPLVDLAKKFHVSHGTVHTRIEKLRTQGIISGSKITLDLKKLGFDVCCFIGINLKSAKDYTIVIKQLKLFDEVVEVHYTTGGYNIFAKVITKSIEELQNFLVKKLQAISEVQSTETLISLETPLSRDVLP